MARSIIKNNQQENSDVCVDRTGGTISQNTVRKIGKIGFLTFVAQNDDISLAGTDALVCIIPEGYRPSSSVRFLAYAKYNGDYRMCTFIMGTGGTVYTKTGSGTFTDVIILNTAYPIK